MEECGTKELRQQVQLAAGLRVVRQRSGRRFREFSHFFVRDREWPVRKSYKRFIMIFEGVCGTKWASVERPGSLPLSFE